MTSWEEIPDPAMQQRLCAGLSFDYAPSPECKSLSTGPRLSSTELRIPTTKPSAASGGVVSRFVVDGGVGVSIFSVITV